MPVLLQIDFPADGPWGPEMSQAYADLASSIAEEQGLIWKIWTENEQAKRAGGVYLFDTAENAKAYLTMHTARIAGFGITEPRAVIFAVNEALTATTRGPVADNG